MLVLLHPRQTKPYPARQYHQHGTGAAKGDAVRGDKRGFSGFNRRVCQRWREFLRNFDRFTNRRRGFVGKGGAQPLRQLDGGREAAGKHQAKNRDPKTGA